MDVTSIVNALCITRPCHAAIIHLTYCLYSVIHLVNESVERMVCLATYKRGSVSLGVIIRLELLCLYSLGMVYSALLYAVTVNKPLPVIGNM